MQNQSEKSDLRVVKTTKMLNAAMYSLLERQSFKKITVRDICDRALISRATFYARFSDKYDFLRSWLPTLMPEGLYGDGSYESIEKNHNALFYKNRMVLRNIMVEIDCETLEIVAEFLLDCFELDDKFDIKQTTADHVVLSRFFAGGMLFYLMWQVKNRLPPDIPPMNKYLYKLIGTFKEWELNTP